MFENLTDRQKQVAILAAKGFSNKEIAREVELSPETVKTHMRNIFLKLNVRRRTHLHRFIQLAHHNFI